MRAIARTPPEGARRKASCSGERVGFTAGADAKVKLLILNEKFREATAKIHLLLAEGISSYPYERPYKQGAGSACLLSYKVSLKGILRAGKEGNNAENRRHRAE